MEKHVTEIVIPHDCISVMFFQDQETMKECSEKWGLFPVIGDGSSIEIDHNFPRVFAAFRKKESTARNTCWHYVDEPAPSTMILKSNEKAE